MSLKHKIAATIFVLEALLIGALLWVTLGYAEQSVRSHIAGSERATLQLMSDLSRVALLTEDYADLQSFINSSNDPRIRSVVIADANGKVVVSTSPVLVGASFPVLKEEDDHHWRVAEVAGHAHLLGTLAVAFSSDALSAVYREIKTLALTVAVIGLGVIGVASIAIGFALTRRLQALAAAADRVADGSSLFAPEIDGNDEVARLARAFSGMAERLQRQMVELKRARDHLIEPTEAMSQGFALWDREGRLVLFNTRFRQMFSHLRRQLLPSLSYDAFSTWASAGATASSPDKQSAAAGPDTTGTDVQSNGQWEVETADGRWTEVHESRTRDGGTVCIFADVTVDKLRQRELRESEQRLRGIMASVSDALITLDQSGTIDSVNEAVERMFGWKASDVVGCSIDVLLALEPVYRRSRLRCSEILDHLTTPRDRPLMEIWGIRRSGQAFPVELAVTETDLNQKRVFICTARDITERKAVEKQIVYHATHDSLTALPNRTSFLDRLNKAIEQAATTGERLAVMFLDLDRFKVINDNLGHPFGDTLLVAVAHRLRRGLRSTDTVARMGGDEFIFLLQGIDDERAAVATGEKIIEMMQPPFVIRAHEVHVTASIGISLHPEHGVSSEMLLQHADIALYQAKAKGKNRVCLFKRSMNRRRGHQWRLETDLRHALERNQFHVAYQPQIDLKSGHVVGLEALVRWQHPRFGALQPSHFIPIAEETGQICSLGRFVLKTACAELGGWWRAYGRPLRLAVNLSPRQIQDPTLLTFVAEIVETAAIDPTFLEFEITENAFIDEDEAAIRQIHPLTAMGVGMVLDDFGTGYSSLSRLKHYPIRRTKIDRSFVGDIARSESDGSLVRATVAIASCLDIGVIAEGIETSDQLSLLCDFGCREGQGFLIGRPASAKQITRLLLDQSRQQMAFAGLPSERAAD